MDRRLKQFIYMCVLTVAVLGVSGRYGYAQEPADKPSFNKEEMKAKWEAKRAEMFKKLGLTSEQQEQLSVQKKKHREDSNVLREQIKAKREALKNELQKPELNVDKVRTIHNELKALRSQMEDRRLEEILATREILTPEQFTKMMQLREESGFKRHKFKGSHKGPWERDSEAPAKTDAE